MRSNVNLIDPIKYSLLTFFLTGISFSPLFSQEDQFDIKIDSIRENRDLLREDRITVFLDCSNCDNQYLQQELNFVNHVRDPALAQVHLFITIQGTASRGSMFIISFIGKKRFEGVDNTITYISVQTNTQDQERKGLASVLKLGLVPYVAHTSLRDEITLNIPGEGGPEQPEKDPWNNWIFEVYGGLEFAEESSVSSLDLRYGLFADYVTSNWRIRLRPYFNYNQRRFEREGEEITSILHRNGFEGRVIRSISDHWSVGVFPSVISSTFENIDFGYRIAPAIEYSLRPYKLALREEYTLAYSIGYLNRTYLEETIFNVTKETLFDHSLQLNVRVLQPWGSVRAGIQGSHYLHDFSKNRLTLNGQLSLRVFRGLSVDFNSRYEYVQDQLNLSRGSASLEDVLLKQRQLATTYGISVSMGISYSFGSIYNNVINTRL
jgi:hypothetical protein